MLGRLSDKSRVSWVSVEILNAWDDNNATLEVGDISNNNRFMQSYLNDLTTIDTYAYNPSFQYSTGGLETEVLVYLDSMTSTKGQARITITYT